MRHFNLLCAVDLHCSDACPCCTISQALGLSVSAVLALTAVCLLTPGLPASAERRAALPLAPSTTSTLQLQLEAGHTGIGGVLPGVPMPRSLENLRGAAAWRLHCLGGGGGGRDVEMEWAVRCVLERNNHALTSKL